MYISRLVLFLFPVLVFMSCSGTDSASVSDPVVANVAGEPIFYSQVRAQFFSSGARPEQEMTREQEIEELREFLPLYVNYRAKLAEARLGGYFVKNEILSELAVYEQQTAQPFWLENRIREQMLDEYIERASVEIHASHMLIMLPQNPVRADTLRAYNRLLEARDKALQGADFDSLSVVYSSMQQGRSVGGDLGYFSVGWAVKDFEDVVFTTPVGGISMPFRTQFGYHIVKVHDVRETVQDRRLSHIFFQTRNDLDVEEALQSAGDIFSDLSQNTITWDQAVEQFSQDRQSAVNNGNIGWVNHGRYDPQFTNVVMSIPSVGDITEPFYSGYGVHIVRLDSIRTFKSDEDFRSEMLSRLQALPRYRETQEFTNKHVREAGSEFIYRDAFDAFESPIYNHTGGFSSVVWDEDVLSAPVYRLNNTTYTAGDFRDWVFANLDTSATTNYHFSVRERFINDVTQNHIVDITKDVFPEFAALSREYLNGLVIFSISEDSVWNYARYDTLSLRGIYEQDPERFQFDDRYFYFRVAANTDSTLNLAISRLQDGISPDSLRREMPGLLIRSDVINDLSQSPFSYLQGLQEGEISQRFDYRNRRTVLLLDRIEPSRTMTFDEAFFRIVSEYQPIRERNWVNRLQQTHNVSMYPERIN
ncbi:MAG: peptidylprolyl isomerase [Bacteroidetes bacterium]|nr:peptidylprolyl isomerase [Bacteroidota bacterium]